jgi:adenosylmethionine-8-amino-7-oxononanoate aminotransferase
MASLRERDLAVLWHPCGQQRDYREFPPLEVVGAEGSRLKLADGREIIDGISSWWCKALGHGHPRLRAALVDQASRFEHVILANTTNEPIVRLSERLCAMANAVLAERRTFSRVFYAGDGSCGVEVALKLALQCQAQRGRPRRRRFAAFANGYHGETVGALSVGDCGIYKETFAPLLFDCAMLGPLPYRSGPGDPRWDDCSREWPAIAAQLEPLADELAAIIYEPILQGAGGMLLYSPDLLRRLRAWADAHEVLLIADEIASGMGRCGAMLASHLAGALPDLAVLSKGLTGGFLPLSAVLVTEAVYAAFDGEWAEGRAFLHSHTYCGNALAVAVAAAALDVFAEEDLLGRVERNGRRLREGVAALARSRPTMRNPRGVGMVAAVDLVGRDGSPLAREARTGWRVMRDAVVRGALLRPLGDTMYILPPLNTPAHEIDALVRILGESVDAVAEAQAR